MVLGTCSLLQGGQVHRWEHVSGLTSGSPILVHFTVGKLSPEANRYSALFMTCMLKCLGVKCTDVSNLTLKGSQKAEKGKNEFMAGERDGEMTRQDKANRKRSL